MKNVLVSVVAAAAFSVAGCSTIDSEGVFSRYYRTTLGQSASADVLGYIQDKKTELLSQTESMLVSGGSANDGKTHWFNMVVFDEEQLAAVRKYCLVVEDYNRFNTKPRATLRFDAEVMTDADAGDSEVYPNKNAMQTGALRRVFKLFCDDAGTIVYDSAELRSSVMMARQALNTVLTRLDQSPAFAARLSEPSGLEFDHITMGPARIRMVIDNSIVKVKIKAGKSMLRTPFESQPDVKDM